MAKYISVQSAQQREYMFKKRVNKKKCKLHAEYQRIIGLH